jgi:alpha-tubulin suppressor-like RCC1 family protein
MIPLLIASKTTAPPDISGNLYMCGEGSTGENGDGRLTDYSSPVQVGSLVKWASLAKNGDSPTMGGIRTDGTLWMWGRGTTGQLGDGTVLTKHAPVQVGTETDWTHISEGSTCTFAIRGGKLFSWGDAGTEGRLGLNSLTDYSSPVQIGTATDWIDISGGSKFAGGIRGTGGSGTAYTWGKNNFGQLGDSSTTNRSSPVQVDGGVTTWTKISCGAATTHFLKGDGTTWATGDNDGTLADGSKTDVSSPVQVGTATNWVQIDAGANTPHGINSDGELFAWGNGNVGALGTGSMVDATSVVQVGSLTDWSYVSMGWNSTRVWAIKTDGTLWGWGTQPGGEIGVGNTTVYSSPVQIGALTTWATFGLCNSISVGLTTDGVMWACGQSNTDGPLGNGEINKNYSSPIQVGNHSPYKLASGGYIWSAAITDEGKMWAWGDGATGKLGVGSTVDHSMPVQVGTASDWVIMATGDQGVCAVNSDNELWSWGDGVNGGLGNGSTTDISTPAQVGSLTDWGTDYLAMGSSFCFNLKTDGTLWGWGLNSGGQLAQGNTTANSSPIQIASDKTFAKIIAGNNFALAIDTAGRMWAWGTGANGRLGDSTTADKSSPVQVGTDTDWKHVNAHSGASAAIKNNGTLWTWGYGAAGRLGNGSTSDTSAPAQVGSLTNWGKFIARANHEGFVHVVKTDGTLWGWGWNVAGPLGNGATTDLSSPVQIGSETDWVMIGDNASNFACIRSTDVFD